MYSLLHTPRSDACSRRHKASCVLEELFDETEGLHCVRLEGEVVDHEVVHQQASQLLILPSELTQVLCDLVSGVRVDELDVLSDQFF